jgi:hypothetical protein
VGWSGYKSINTLSRRSWQKYPEIKAPPGTHVL